MTTIFRPLENEILHRATRTLPPLVMKQHDDRSHGERRTLRAATAVMALGLLASGLTVLTPAFAQTTLTVTNNLDYAGPATSGSLRQVLQYQAINCYSGPFTITFNITGVGPQTIQPDALNGPLPDISCNGTVIDGYSQPGSSPNSVSLSPPGSNNAIIQIILDGTSAGTSRGLTISGDNVAVKGLAIRSFAQEGIFVQGNNAAVLGSYIGTDPGGMAGYGNASYGIKIGFASTGTTIGDGTSPGSNFITNNGFGGIQAQGGTVSNVTIWGNQIGGDRSGGSTISSGGNGIDLPDAGSGSVVKQNAIRYHSGNGVSVGATVTNVQITQNRIYTGQKGINTNSTGNGGLAAPVLTSLALDSQAETLTIQGTYSAASSSSYLIEQFEGYTLVPTVPSAFYYDSYQTYTATTPPTTQNFSLAAGASVRDVSLTLGRGGVGTSEFTALYRTPFNFSPGTWNNNAPSISAFAVVAGAAVQYQTITVTNSSDAVVSYGSSPVTVTGAGFSVADGATPCAGSSAGPNGQCQFKVGFASGSAGSFTGSLTFTVVQNGVTSTSTVPLSATAVAGPIFSASPSLSVDFGSSQVVGTTSPTQTVTVTNTGPDALNFSGISFYGPDSSDLSEGGTCTSTTTLPQLGTCTFTFSFTPSSTTPYSATVVIDTNAPNTPHTITISGTGVALGAPVITSGAPAGGLQGQPYSFSFAATGTAPITWSIIAGSLPPGLTLNSSTGVVSGTPTSIGNSTFTIQATNGAGSISQATAISVTSPIFSIISLSTNTLNFGNQNVDLTSVAQTVTITNTGTSAFSIFSISGIGDFGYTPDCSPAVPLQPNGSCTLSVTFTPLAAGLRTGRISVNNNADQQGSNGNSITLSGTGVVVPRPNIIINPATSFAFGDQALSTSSPPQVFFVSNIGQATLELQGFSLTGAGSLPSTSFSVVPAAAADNPRSHPLCVAGNSILAGASCAIGVTFSPAATGPLTGRITITHNATPSGATGTSIISISGTGTPRREPLIRVSGTVTFAEQALGSTSEAKPVTITNIGTVDLNVGNLTITPNAVTSASDFLVSGICGVLIPNANCNLNVAFSPNASGTTGPKGATLTASSNATNAGPSTSQVALLGTAIPVPAPIVQLSATTIGFGNVIYGSTGARQVVTLKNTGTLALNISGVNTSGNSDFSQTNTCGSTVNPDQSCLISLLFSPHALGARSGVLNILSNAPTARVQLGGTGCRYFSPAAARFFLTSC